MQGSSYVGSRGGRFSKQYISFALAGTEWVGGLKVRTEKIRFKITLIDD